MAFLRTRGIKSDDEILINIDTIERISKDQKDYIFQVKFKDDPNFYQTKIRGANGREINDLAAVLRILNGEK